MMVRDFGSSSRRSASSSGGMRMAPATASCIVAYEADETTSKITASPDLTSASASAGEIRRSGEWAFMSCSPDKLTASAYAVAMLLPDVAWMQETTLWLAGLVAVLSLGSIFLGLVSIGTGKDYLPTRVRRLLSRVPASEDDHRLRGMSLVLNGAATTIFALGITASTLAMINRGSFPKGLFFVTAIAFLAAIACSIGSSILFLRGAV